MPGLGCAVLALFLLLLILLPLAFSEVLTIALLKLRLTPEVALLLVVGIVLGSGINIPVKRIARTDTVLVDPLTVFGLAGWWPRMQQARCDTVIAVNVGGCLVPTGLALYETIYVLMQGAQGVVALVLAVLVNSAVCYALAKPVPRIGIAIPGLIPPLVAVTTVMLLTQDLRPPIAFVAGVLGPLIGADLMHLREIPQMATGMASIGGAGTFDGIVLSGIVAAYLA